MACHEKQLPGLARSNDLMADGYASAPEGDWKKTWEALPGSPFILQGDWAHGLAGRPRVFIGKRITRTISIPTVHCRAPARKTMLEIVPPIAADKPSPTTIHPLGIGGRRRKIRVEARIRTRPKGAGRSTLLIDLGQPVPGLARSNESRLFFLYGCAAAGPFAGNYPSARGQSGGNAGPIQDRLRPPDSWPERRAIPPGVRLSASRPNHIEAFAGEIAWNLNWSDQTAQTPRLGNPGRQTQTLSHNEYLLHLGAARSGSAFL